MGKQDTLEGIIRLKRKQVSPGAYFQTETCPFDSLRRRNTPLLSMCRNAKAAKLAGHP